MPNYVKNKLVISPSDFDKIVAECIHKDEEGKTNFDFNRLIRMPKELLDVTCGTPTNDGILIVYATSDEDTRKSILKAIKGNMWLKQSVTSNWKYDYEQLVEKLPEERIALYRAQGQIALSNLARYGSFCWYDWSVRNWGTKWNACETDWDTYERSITYLTAWSSSLPVVIELSRRYRCRIDFYYADEDIGRNTGMLIVDSGKVLHEERFEDGSKQAYVMACGLWKEDIADYIDETWETIDGNPMYVLA